MELLHTHFGLRSGYCVPRTNIGAMRLPGDMDEAVALIRHAIDSGMRYIDTSRCYGDSELKLARALKDGYREKVILSTKWSPWISKIEPSDDASAECVLKRIRESMARLEVEVLDFYQVWNIQSPENYADTVRPGGFLDGIKEAMKLGLVKHTGTTSHDSPENLLRYLDDMEWCEVLLVSYNLLDRRYAPVLAKAKELGIGTIVMNPLGGGKIAEDSPAFNEIKERTGSPTVADLAIRYVLSNPDVDTIISGISRTSDVDDTLASGSRSLFDEPTLRAIDAFVDGLSNENVQFCTRCGYCSPCEQGVDIPGVMDALYHITFLGFERHARWAYGEIVKRNAGADRCTECGECAPKCTQKLDILEQMALAARSLGDA